VRNFDLTESNFAATQAVQASKSRAQRRQIMKIFFYISVTMAVLFSIALARALVTGLVPEGTVIDGVVIGKRSSSSRQSSGSESVTTYAPLIQIEDQNGNKVIIHATTYYTTTPDFKDGDIIRVRLNKDRPEDSAIESLWGIYGRALVLPLVTIGLWVGVFFLRRLL